MKKDKALLSELHDLEGGQVHEHLKQMRDKAVERWTKSDDERADLILKGEKRVLDQLIGEIESAYTEYKELREKESRPSMSKAF